MGWVDVTPEEQAMLDGGAAAKPTKAPRASGTKSKWVDASPEEVAMLERGSGRVSDVGPYADAYQLPKPPEKPKRADVPQLPPQDDLPERRPRMKDTLSDRDRAFIPAEAQAQMFNRPEDLERARRSQIALVAGTAAGAVLTPVLAPLAAAGAPTAATMLNVMGQGAAARAANAALDRQPVAKAAFDPEAAKEDLSVAGALHLPFQVAGIGEQMAAGASRRMDDRTVSGLVEGGTGRQQEKILGERGSNREDLLAVAKDTEGLPAAAGAKKTTKALDLVDAKKTELVKDNAATMSAADRVSMGVPRDEAVASLAKIRDALMKDPGKMEIAEIIQKKIDNIERAWGDYPLVPLKDIHTLRQDLGPAAFRSAPGVDPSKAERAARDVYFALSDIIEKHVAKVAPQAGLPETAVATLRANNKKISELINVEDALSRRARLEATGKSKSIKDQALDLALGGSNAAAAANFFHGGSSVPLVATASAAAIRHTLPWLSRSADRALVALYKAAETNAAPRAIKELADEAIAAGVPRAIAEGAASQQSRDQK